MQSNWYSDNYAVFLGNRQAFFRRDLQHLICKNIDHKEVVEEFMSGLTDFVDDIHQWVILSTLLYLFSYILFLLQIFIYTSLGVRQLSKLSKNRLNVFIFILV